MSTCVWTTQTTLQAPRQEDTLADQTGQKAYGRHHPPARPGAAPGNRSHSQWGAHSTAALDKAGHAPWSPPRASAAQRSPRTPSVRTDTRTQMFPSPCAQQPKPRNPPKVLRPRLDRPPVRVQGATDGELRRCPDHGSQRGVRTQARRKHDGLQGSRRLRGCRAWAGGEAKARGSWGHARSRPQPPPSSSDAAFVEIYHGLHFRFAV